MATSRQLREQIAAGRWDAALAALYGGSEKVLARQRSRYGAALEQFELYYGPGRQVQVYSAPGRTELGGNHTDHQHGYGLAGAVTLDLVAVASRNEDGFIRVKSRGFNKLDVIDLTEAEPQQGESTHSASLIRGIAEGFRAKGCDVGGFDAYTASDVLRGSGLSSSAAFEMGVAMILNMEYGCGLDAPALARICQFAENTYFGKPSGLLDQLTSAVGGVLFADFADPTAPKIEKIQTIPSTAPERTSQLTAACTIRMSEDETHLFCSNAGDNSVSVYERDAQTGLLKLLCCLPISGDYPKDIAIFPDGNHLASINHGSNSISFFQVEYKEKLLVMSGRSISVNEPNCCVITKVPTRGKKAD